MKDYFKLCLFLSVLVFQFQCKENGEDPVPLQAIVDELSVTTFSPGDPISFNASNSTGADQGYYIWSVSGSGFIEVDGQSYDLSSQPEFSGTDKTSFSFSTVYNGYFTTTLRIEKNGSFSSSGGIGITVSGSIILNSVPEGYDFINIDLNGSENVDYIITGNVTLTGVNIEGNVIIEFSPDIEVIVESISTPSSSLVTFRGEGDGSWKGFLFKGYMSVGGTVNINNAGASTYSGYENAAVIFESGNLFEGSGLVNFTGSTGFDIYLADDRYSLGNLTNFTFSNQNMINAPLLAWPNLPYNTNLSESGGYYTLRGDKDVTISWGGSVTINLLTDIRILGGVNTSTEVTLTGNGTATIYMEENTPFVAPNRLTVSNVSFDGIDGAGWQGIYLNSNQALFQQATIKNAGSAPISTANITGIQEKAAIYCATFLAAFDGSTIENSGGYGIYMSDLASWVNDQGRYDNNTFSGNSLSPISVPPSMATIFSKDNSFTTSGLAAIEVRPGSGYPVMSWRDLGDDNFYNIKGNITVSGGQPQTFDAGAHLKFDDNKTLWISGANMTVNGLSGNEVIFEGMNSGATSWNGILFGNNQGTRLIADYMIIDGGGSNSIAGITEKGNLMIDASGLHEITNSTFSNSNGYGVVIELNANEIDVENAAFSNTFTNNASGNVINKNN